MFKAINDLIINYTDYDDDSIFKNYYNNVPLPKDNTFCIIRELHSRPKTALVQRSYIPNVAELKVDESANQLVITHFQVDFYGVDSSNAATRLATVLEAGFANEFFLANGFDYTVEDSEQPHQISYANDRDNYILRYIVRFSLFNNSIINQTVLGTNKVQINPILIETLKE